MSKIFLIGLLTALIVGCSDETPQTEQVQSEQVKTDEIAQSDNEIREKAKQHFLGDNEPVVKDAMWAKPNLFKVGVVDDGTSRDGFAEYVCEVLRTDFDIKDSPLMVEVIDIQQLVNNNKWIELGGAVCQ
ncbi:hypothetical protein [Moraxella bovoculi]|uniref:hypothetical protein n=1 Tax=Moraxella bovoculi TaxID=386891 RepID=UPI000A60A770|nr:hypothetical protein [Moraxella bovoculi]